MFKITQKHLAATFIPPFIMSTVFFVVFLLTFQLLRLTRIIISKGVDFLVVLKLIGHICMTFLPMAIPLSALFATIYTLNKLSEDSEIVAMRSFGLSKFTIFKPFLILGLATAMALFSLNMQLIPTAKRAFKNEIIRLTSKGVLADIRPEHFFTEIPGITLFAEKVSTEGDKLENVFINVNSKGGSEERVIFAKFGHLIKKSLDKNKTPTLRMHLSDGNIVKSFKDKPEVEKIIFQEYDFPIFEAGLDPGFVNKDSMLGMNKLSLVIKNYKKKISSIKEKGLLAATDNRILQETSKDLDKALIEYWSRVNTPLQVIIFIFLGFSLGIKKGRGKAKNMGPIGLFILLGYYTLFFLGVSLSKKGLLHPAVSVFLPSLVAFVLAKRFYNRLDWLG